MSDGNLNNPVTEVNPQTNPEVNPEVNPETTPESNWINPDGSFGDLTKAPEEYRAFIENKGYKGVDNLIKQNKELEGFVGQRDKLIKLPDEGDTEGWNEIYGKLGRPENKEGYQYDIPEKHKELVDENLLNLFREHAFSQGMNQKAFSETVQFQLDAALGYMQAQQEATEEAQKAIRERFSTEDQYNEFTQKAMKFATDFKLSENKSVMDVLEAKELAHDPEILDMLGQISDRTAEDPLPSGEARVPQSEGDKLDEIKKNPAFVDRGHPDHDKVMDEFWKLFNIKRGNQ